MSLLAFALALFPDPLPRRAPPPEGPAGEPPGPLDHPEIARMTPRELADLPLPRPPLASAAGRR